MSRGRLSRRTGQMAMLLDDASVFHEGESVRLRFLFCESNVCAIDECDNAKPVPFSKCQFDRRVWASSHTISRVSRNQLTLVRL
jgi:hypothetical protein